MWNNYNTAYPGNNNPPYFPPRADGAPPLFPSPGGFASPGGAPPPSSPGYHPSYGSYSPSLSGPGEFDNASSYQPPQTTPYSLPPSNPYPPPNRPQPLRSTYPGQQAQSHYPEHSPGPLPGYLGQPPHSYPSPGHNGPPPPGSNHYMGSSPAMPPGQQQSYGPVYQDANHQNVQQTFQYSQCNGKKKALCIGINYFGQQGELKGCINDAHNVKRFLCGTFGYREEDIVILTDDARNPRQIPTGANMLQAMEWLVRDAKMNDSLFFHYSGHGGQTKDLDGDEEDGYDEVIYPVDYKQNGHILDDTMFEIMVRPLPPGCRLTAIFDSCHSGSALDLPFMYTTEGKIKEPNMAADLGQGLMGLVSSYSKKDMGGVLKSGLGIIRTAGGQSQKIDKWAKQNRSSPADVISWGGCKDSQTSADTFEAGQATGAMSFAFISVLSANNRISYQQLLTGIRNILQSKYSQKPQLSSSHPIDTVNLLFIC